ncbi:MAG: hypothetical protein CVU88_06515 [Firmicutes bacterium HGW-Firmicutes-13]|nr:MAG: hypothetical protein CVU88_06515 [Firmicutes bacterium HGW-Firmicutes-13]
MEKVKVLNLSKGTIILEEAEVADNFFLRLKGLLGRSGLLPGKGLLIKPCKAVHTVGMSFPIDVGFVDKEGCICCQMENMFPNQFSPTVRKAKFVIEAPAGTFQMTETAVGDYIELIKI